MGIKVSQPTAGGSESSPVLSGRSYKTVMIHRKVLHIINSLDIGGAEVLLVNFIRYAPKNYSMEVCVLYPGGALRPQLLSLGVPLYDMHLPSKYALWKAYQLIELIKSNRYDIVHAHLFPSILLGAWASRIARGPLYVCTEHGTWNRRRQFLGFRYLDRWMYSHYSKVICVSSAVRRSLESWVKLEPNRLVVIPSGVPIPEEADTSKAPSYDLVFLGRLEYEKGLDILLHALALLKQMGYSPRLIVVGTGRQATRLQKLVHHLELGSQVVFAGYQSDTRSFLADARILVLPSRHEGLPISLLEGMAMGKGIIATATGGIVDAIEDGKEAILVAPESASALADAIARLLKDPQELQMMGNAARAKALSHFSIERHVREIIQLYQALG